MKKLLSIAMALCILLCAFAACGKQSKDKKEQGETAAEETEKIGENAVLYDANDIKISSAGFSRCKEYDNQLAVMLEIENNTGKELTVHPCESSVNGWMNDPNMLTVREGGIVNVDSTFVVPIKDDTNRYYLYFDSGMLDTYGITEITEAEFILEMVPGEDYENAIYTDMLRVTNPNASGDAEQPVNDSGKVAYEKNGVKIVFQETGYDSDFFGPTVFLYAFNGSDKPILIRIPNSSFNGEEHEAFGDMIIAPGKHVRQEVLFSDVGGAAPISTVTMTFDIFEYYLTGDGQLLDTSVPFTVDYSSQAEAADPAPIAEEPAAEAPAEQPAEEYAGE